MAPLKKDRARLRVPAFVYHAVPSEVDASDALAVSAHSFTRQIRALAGAGYKGISASDWLDYCRQGRQLPPKVILITLDDAYEALVSHALPVLCNFGFSATVFVITSLVGEIWQGHRAMSASQIREWSRNGIEFGAHTRTHPNLRMVRGTQLLDEIAGSRDELAQVLGSQPAAFAYPFGEFSAEAVEVARETFAVAFSTEGGLNTWETDRHLLRRSVVFQSDTVPMIRAAALTGFNPVYEIRKAVGIRRKVQAFHRLTGYRFCRSPQI